MSQIKTFVLFIGLTFATSQGFAYGSITECVNATMKEEGIAQMQNRFVPNSIAGKAMAQIKTFCIGLFPSSYEQKPADAELQTLECNEEECPQQEQPTEIEI